MQATIFCHSLEKYLFSQKGKVKTLNTASVLGRLTDSNFSFIKVRFSFSEEYIRSKI